MTRNESQEKYYQAHRDEIREKNRLWRINHIESARESCRVYRQKNLEREKARAIEYRLKHREERLAYAKQYRLTHKEQIYSYNKEYRKTYSDTKKEKIRQQIKAYNRANSERQKSLKLSKMYGITIDDYLRILAKQNGVCAVCGKTGGQKCLSVDHNHNTGKVRGLLCQRCNLVLGRMEDNPALIVKLAKYVKVANKAALKAVE